MNQHRQYWNQFCTTNNIATDKVPLFETSSGLFVKTKQIGKPTLKSILCRHPEMDTLIRTECAKLIEDWKQKAFAYDGLIYMMLAEEPEGVVPLYIGKTETLGKTNGNLSANIKNIKTDTQKFARWGDNYKYHIGDLSAAVLLGHDPKEIKYKYIDWARSLFDKHPTDAPALKRKLFFWTKAWSSKNLGPWVEFGPTSLTFLEYLLIGVASSIFGDVLLNLEGRNRG
jgi:hypothetical protein